MIKHIFLFGFAAISMQSGAQIRYEPGYFVTNEGKKVSCLIKNEDWYKSPKSFLYKRDDQSAPETGRLVDVKEFYITNGSRYIRYRADIDTSAVGLQTMSRNREPEFKQEQVYLKLLTGGAVNLYGYTEGDIKRYFFSRADSVITPLVYKQYLVDDKKISENTLYQTQILQIMNETATGISKGQIMQTRYTEKALIKLFRQFNGAGSKDYVQKTSKQDRFNLTLKAGAQLAALKLRDDVVPGPDSRFGGKVTPRLGIEAESILPFKKNKWGVFAGVFYSSYKSTIRNANNLETADYKAISFSLGGRHYFFVNDYSRLFVAGEINLAVPVNSYIHKEQYDRRFDPMLNLSPVLAAGWKTKKYSIELRYAFPINIIDHMSVSTRYQVAALTLGYDLF